jgi:hypothetical protein
MPVGTSIALLAFMDDLAPLVFLLFAGGSAFLNWLKKRKERKQYEHEAAERARRGEPEPQWEDSVAVEAEDDYASPVVVQPPQPKPQPAARSWEEELKRLLEGDFANPPPQQKAEPPPLPPVVVLPAPAPARREPVRPARRAPEPEPVLPTLPPVFSRGGQTEDAPSHETHEGYGHLSTLGQSAKAYDRASHLSDLVAAKLAAMDSKTAFLPPETQAIHRRIRSDDMVSVLKLLRTPSSARQVILAQTILGTPKGLEV